MIFMIPMGGGGGLPKLPFVLFISAILSVFAGGFLALLQDSEEEARAIVETSGVVGLALLGLMTLYILFDVIFGD